MPETDTVAEAQETTARKDAIKKFASKAARYGFAGLVFFGTAFALGKATGASTDASLEDDSTAAE